jgi:hypothetical protein
VEQIKFPFMEKLEREYKIRRLLDKLSPHQILYAAHAALAQIEKEKALAEYITQRGQD